MLAACSLPVTTGSTTSKVHDGTSKRHTQTLPAMWSSGGSRHTMCVNKWPQPPKILTRILSIASQQRSSILHNNRNSSELMLHGDCTEQTCNGLLCWLPAFRLLQASAHNQPAAAAAALDEGSSTGMQFPNSSNSQKNGSPEDAADAAAAPPSNPPLLAAEDAACSSCRSAIHITAL